jgi:hypothetical protein
LRDSELIDNLPSPNNPSETTEQKMWAANSGTVGLPDKHPGGSGTTGGEVSNVEEEPKLQIVRTIKAFDHKYLEVQQKKVSKK